LKLIKPGLICKRSAIRWLKENAYLLKTGPEKIAAGGLSTVGQPALLLRNNCLPFRNHYASNPAVQLAELQTYNQPGRMKKLQLLTVRGAPV
jgi:hypothetical protein